MGCDILSKMCNVLTVWRLQICSFSRICSLIVCRLEIRPFFGHCLSCYFRVCNFQHIVAHDHYVLPFALSEKRFRANILQEVDGYSEEFL